MNSLSLVATCRYTVDELLGLRASLPIVVCPIENVNNHVDIASIFRIPEEAFDNPKRFSCPSKSLANITSRRLFSQESRRNFIESSEGSEDRMTSSMNSNSKCESRQSQWNFRRRESSDRSSQPHSAPTDIAAQQSENFQRFYRAVVSPTHVRVTAGGRIVPNTRATTAAPPQFEWKSDKFRSASRKSTSEHELSNSHSMPLLPNTMLPLSYSHIPANAFAPPYNLGSQCNHLTGVAPQLQVGNSGNISGSGGDAFHIANVNGDALSGTLQPGTLPQTIKISPPSQFDQSKPFIFNGQVVYPVPQGFQPPPTAVPMGLPMLGNTGFLPQAHLPNGNGFLSAFPGAMPAPMIFPGQPIPLMIPNLVPAEHMPPMVPYLPMRNLLQVEALKGQIQQLRNQVKFCDHQLANNKHQIDEHFMETQKAIFSGQIKNLELMLDFQLAQETGVASSTQTTENAPGSQVAAVAPPVAYSTKPASEDNSKQPLEPHKVPNGAKGSLRAELTTKSRLSINAPAFQPRSQALVLASQAHQPDANSGNNTHTMGFQSTETQSQIESRLLARSTADWGGSKATIGSSGVVTLSRAQSNQELVLYDQSNKQASTLQRSATFHGQEFTPSSTAQAALSSAVPYLVGTLPHGVHASLAKSTDFLYSRPLTDEEIRARHLYWGKAPRSIQSGLPKFDGKDFYPPSPVKQSGRINTTQHSTGSSTDLGDNNYAVSSAFENLFTEPGVPGYKTPSPTHSFCDHQPILPMPQPCFVTGPNEHAMLPPQTGIFTDSGISMNGWPAGNAKVGEQSHKPATPPHTLTYSNGVLLDDFSKLFTEPGVPGYKSPSPPKTSQDTSRSEKQNAQVPATPTNPVLSAGGQNMEGDAISVGSRKHNDETRQRVNSESDTIASPGSTRNGARSSSSSVEIHLSPQAKSLSPKSAHEKAFVERVENFRSSEQQTLFLQNMLRNASQSPMVGTALSGEITSATAQGYLPLYRGSAAASLAPAMLNNAVADRDSQHCQPCADTTKESRNGLVAFTSADVMSENRPLYLERTHTSIGSEESGAQGYMRYLTQKDDKNKKMIDQVLDPEISVAGQGPRPQW